MYVVQSFEEHETLSVSMENARAEGAKLLEGFKVVRARHLVPHTCILNPSLCIICIYVMNYEWLPTDNTEYTGAEYRAEDRANLYIER